MNVKDYKRRIRNLKAKQIEYDKKIIPVVKLKKFFFPHTHFDDDRWARGTRFPAGFDRRYLDETDPKKFIWKKRHYRNMELPDKAFILCGQQYVNPDRLLELLDRFETEAISLIQYGEFFHVINGHHRMVVAYLTQRLVNVEINICLFREG